MGLFGKKEVPNDMPPDLGADLGPPGMGGPPSGAPPMSGPPPLSSSMGPPPGMAPPMGGSPPPMGSPMSPPPMSAPPVSAPAPMSPPSGGSDGNPTLERIEEIAEAIIDEKWNEMVRTINKVIDWKDRTEGTLQRMQQQMTDLSRRMDTLTQGVLGKVNEYNSSIRDVGVEIKAMEKVFQQILPGFIENVHTLDRVSREMSSKKR